MHHLDYASDPTKRLEYVARVVKRDSTLRVIQDRKKFMGKIRVKNPAEKLPRLEGRVVGLVEMGCVDVHKSYRYYGTYKAQG